MCDESKVKQRIKELLKARHVSESKLSRLGPFSQKKLNNQFSDKAKLQVETLLFVLGKFPEVSVSWLIKGEGSMFETGNKAELQSGLPDYSSMINSIIAAKDDAILALKEQMAAKEETVSTLRDTIASLQEQLNAKDSIIAEYQAQEKKSPYTYGIAEQNPKKYTVNK